MLTRVCFCCRSGNDDLNTPDIDFLSFDMPDMSIFSPGMCCNVSDYCYFKTKLCFITNVCDLGDFFCGQDDFAWLEEMESQLLGKFS